MDEKMLQKENEKLREEVSKLQKKMGEIELSLNDADREALDTIADERREDDINSVIDLIVSVFTGVSEFIEHAEFTGRFENGVFSGTDSYRLNIPKIINPANAVKVKTLISCKNKLNRAWNKREREILNKKKS